jgi:photosystem II stability/assembly factor-like uncharacterized protein
VWKSTNAGASWTPLTDNAPSLQIGALTVIPGPVTGQDLIYAGTGKSDATCDSELGQGILRSSDGGQTWIQLATSTFSGLAFTRIAASSSNPSVLYASTEAPFTGPAAGVCMLPEGTKAGLYKSSDAGATWAMLSGGGGLPGPGIDPGAATDVVVDPTNNSIVYVGIQGTPPLTSGGVWKSTNGGATWSQLTNGLPQGANRIAFSISPDGTTLYAARATSSMALDGVYRSGDRGATWSRQGAPVSDVFCLPENQPYYGMVVQMDPASANFNTDYLGLRAIYGSHDGGASWQYLGTAAHPDYHAIVVNSAGLFVGNDGGIAQSADGGSHWDNSLNNGLGITEMVGISVPPAETAPIFAGAVRNGSNLYTGSLGWSHSDDGNGGFALIDTFPPMTFFGELNNTSGQLRLQRSSSADFNTFTNVAPPSGDPVEVHAPFTGDPANGQRILFGTNRVWESCSVSPSLNCNGETGLPPQWTAISGDLTGGCLNQFCDLTDLEVAPSDSGVLYAASGSDGVTGPKMWVSTNSTGASPTFLDITVGLPSHAPITSIAVHPAKASTVMVSLSGFTGGGKHVFLSSDEGKSWGDISAGLPDVPANKVMFDRSSPDTALYAGTDLGVFRSTNAGSSWGNLNNGTLPAVPVSDLRQNRNMIAAATNGRGVWNIVTAPTDTPTATPTPSPTPTATPTSSPTPTPSPTPAPTATPTPSSTSTPTPVPRQVRTRHPEERSPFRGRRLTSGASEPKPARRGPSQSRTWARKRFSAILTAAVCRRFSPSREPALSGCCPITPGALRSDSSRPCLGAIPARSALPAAIQLILR